MKIRTINSLLIIDVLTLILILIVTLAPSSVWRIIIGIPYLLLFPGYTLIAALFTKKGESDVISTLALSTVLSIAIASLIGFGLNFTAWGISLRPVLYSISIFTIVMSTVAFIRGARLFGATQLKLKPGIKFSSWGGSTFQSSLTIALIVSIIGAVGVLGFNSTAQTGEKFTEFYILGVDGKAQDYPSELILENGQVTLTRYGTNEFYTAGGWGKVILGIVNQEKQDSVYSVRVRINEEFADINSQGNMVSELTQITLSPEQKWEQEIGFAPPYLGDNQKVEFLLFMEGSDTAKDVLQLLIDVKELK